MHTNARCSRVAFTLLASIVCSAGANAATWFVRADAAPGGDGTSWSTAFPDVQLGLAAAVAGDQVWVAEGTYFAGGPADPRTASFVMKPGVELYGGFAGTESALAERDWIANPTVLSGDRLGDDGPDFANRGDNVLHVVRATGTLGQARLDGFAVRGGNANGGPGEPRHGGGLYGARAALRNLLVVDNEADRGGGLYNPVFQGTVPVEDCVFRGNRAALEGGGLYLNTSSLVLRRCIVAANSAASGGGMHLFNGDGGPDCLLENCLVVGNSGGGIDSLFFDLEVVHTTIAYNHGPGEWGGLWAGPTSSFAATLVNSIVWGNTADQGGNAYAQNLGGQVQVIFPTAVQGGTPPLDVDPAWDRPLGLDQVAGTADDDFRLSCLSPYIDAGDNTHAAGMTTDLAGNPRFADDPATSDTGAGTGGPLVDLGPYEFVCACDDVTAYCAAVPNTSGLPASISASGSTSLFANSLVLHVVDGPPLKNGLFFYGALQTSVPFGDGIRCVGGSLFRLQVVALDAGGSVSFPLDVTAPPASGGPGLISEGSTWNFQYYFRDPAGGPAGWNASNALSVAFCR